MQSNATTFLKPRIIDVQNLSPTHAKVIINEALELARSFSGDDAVRFINGILDGIRRKLGRE